MDFIASIFTIIAAVSVFILLSKPSPQSKKVSKPDITTTLEIINKEIVDILEARTRMAYYGKFMIPQTHYVNVTKHRITGKLHDNKIFITYGESLYNQVDIGETYNAVIEGDSYSTRDDGTISGNITIAGEV